MNGGQTVHPVPSIGVSAIEPSSASRANPFAADGPRVGAGTGSAHGASGADPEPVRQGHARHASLVELQLELHGNTVTVRAKVVWPDSPERAGIKFDSFDGDGCAEVAELRSMLLAEAAGGTAAAMRGQWLRSL
jgi:hypothetical protein